MGLQRAAFLTPSPVAWMRLSERHIWSGKRHTWSGKAVGELWKVSSHPDLSSAHNCCKQATASCPQEREHRTA